MNTRNEPSEKTLHVQRNSFTYTVQEKELLMEKGCSQYMK